MAEVYSHSRLSTFEDCPRRFQYRYLWKVPAESESIEGFVGKRVHEVLERLHRAVDAGRLPSLPKVIARYGQLFDEAYDAEQVRIVREGTPLAYYRELGEHCIANYYHERYPFDRDRTLGLEEHLRFDLDPEGRYRMQGFVDRIARAPDGAIEIQDYKTAARLPSQNAVDAERQLALYQIGLPSRFRGKNPVIRLVWYFLRHGVTRVSTRSPEQLRDLAGKTRQLIDRIRNETRFAPKTSALCRWCEYREGCPASPERRADVAEYAPPPAAEVARAARSRPAAAASAEQKDQLAFSFSQG